MPNARWKAFVSDHDFVELTHDRKTYYFDRKHLFVGECKWQQHVDVDGELERLKTIASGLPFAREHQLHFGLFLKEKPGTQLDCNAFCPDDVMTTSP